MAFTTFRDWFFEQFPSKVQDEDVNKDTDGNGSFKRYLRVFGVELDEQIMPYIDNFMDILDITKCDKKFLPLIGRLLGDPPSFGPDPDQYRKLLAYIISVYKVKGTILAYKIFFGIIGLKAYLKMDIPRKKITYDMKNIKYDVSPTPYFYDSSCEYCSNYYLALNNGDNTDIDQDLLDRIESIVCFLQPINAKFGGFIESLFLQDTYEGLITDLGLLGSDFQGSQEFDTDEFDQQEFN